MDGCRPIYNGSGELRWKKNKICMPILNSTKMKNRQSYDDLRVGLSKQST